MQTADNIYRTRGLSKGEGVLDMKLFNLLIILIFLIWPLSIAMPAMPDLPIFDYSGDGQLKFLNTHSNELMEIVYRDQEGNYLEEGLGDIDYILRCRLTDEMISMDLELITLIDHIQDRFDIDTIEVLSGYRSTRLNSLLRRRKRGVARRSLHIEGKAIDIRIPGVSMRTIRDYAVLLGVGGVGYYRRSNFVHIDVGPVKRW